MDKWYDRGITFVLDLFKNDATILEYEEFKTLSPSYVHLLKTCLCFNERKTVMPKLLLDGVCLLDKKCNSKHIKQLLGYSVYTSPRCKIFGMIFLTIFNGREHGYCLKKYCISNKI